MAIRNALRINSAAKDRKGFMASNAAQALFVPSIYQQVKVLDTSVRDPEDLIFLIVMRNKTLTIPPDPDA